jgi:serine beta-lactamase-like protein LACTB, mitochondrial
MLDLAGGKIKISLMLIAAGMFLFSPGILFPQALNTELDNYLTTYYHNKEVPSISAGVAKNGKIVWLGARGYADIENMVPATSKTVYRIASISKTITAVAVMQLVEQKKIDLDVDVKRYIPYLPQFKWKFTTRQLLNHTSGIRDYRQGEFDSKIYYRNTRDVVEYIAKDSLAYEPGTQYRYSTIAYNLLAAIIERVSGMSFSDYLEKHIFLPSGMMSTFVELQQDIVQNRAHGYIRDGFRKIRNAPLADLSIKYPGGGIISTSEDLLKFAMSLMQGKLLNHATIDTMSVSTRLKSGKYISYGLGFGIGTDSRGIKYLLHTGGGTGFSSLLTIYPSEKMATIHLINARDRNLDNPAETLAQIMLKEHYQIPKKSFADYLVSIARSANVDSAITAIKNANPKLESEYNVSTEELILFGNDLLNMGRSVDGIKFFRFFVNEYPENVNGFIGLGDAYYKDGNIGLAINSFRLALRVDPLNIYADKMIRKLNNIKGRS